MKHTFYLTLGLAGLLLAGCSSTPTKVSSGTIRARSFSFVAGGSKAAPAFADNREAMHAAIQQAISKNLTARNLTAKPTGGDLTVAYLVIVGDNATTESIGTYFGYGRDVEALHDKAHDAYTESKNPDAFKAGTLLIDLIDAKSFKLLSRSYVVRPILRDGTAEVRAQRLQSAVNEALKDVTILP